MGNYIGSSLIASLRSSLSGSTLLSQTSAEDPRFVDPTTLPGVARAWVKFNGLHPANTQCTIFSKSSNVQGVTSQGNGDYKIGFNANTFSDVNYIVTGSVISRETRNLTSAANQFFVLDPTYKSGVKLTPTEFRIQTIYSRASASAIYEGPAFAHIVNLVIFK
jgi:hypothetical protein